MATSIESYRKAVNSVDVNIYTKALNNLEPDYSDAVGTIGAHTAGAASVGAVVGSVVPGIGTAMGAGVGGIAGATVGMLTSVVGSDVEAADRRKELLADIEKYQKRCDLLASIMSCNIEKDIDDSIESIKQAKKLISKQEIDIKGSQNNPKTLIIKELDQRLKDLKEIKTINKTFITRLRTLGKGEKLSSK